jgi:SecD/SecF fusion protein
VNASEVRESVLKALGTNLKIELRSTFNGVDQNEEAVEGKLVIPIENADQQIAGFNPNELADYIGGAAIVLENLDPPISPAEIQKRIERTRLQPQAGRAAPAYREFTVVSESANSNEPVRTAIVLVTDPRFGYDTDEARWRQEVAAPFWRLVKDAVNSEANLTRVANFNSQVAKETQTDALVALTLSILVIMAYIWVRFGNFKYGTATVVALLHDTLFTLAAVGLAHYAVQWAYPLANALMLEPFRINLTLVAAVLTVMGYSMNDTVVVFDRIRENRGKFGHVDRQVVNDSINQTLSRTLLTGGTTILTIFVMYVFGGPGIHGFTFALLIGILVGTYSSIAIASPILLIGGAPEERAGDSKKRPVGLLLRA